MDKSCKILVMNGPNLATTGVREPAVYGTNTLEDINSSVEAAAVTLDVQIEFFQSNHEGDLIDKLNSVLCESAINVGDNTVRGMIINAGALTHYSYALRDAIAATGIPCVEVHMSNVDAREDFRRTSVIGPVCVGAVQGFGGFSYHLALAGLVEYIKTMDGKQ